MIKNKLVFFSILICNSILSFAGNSEVYLQKNIKYQSYTGECPSKSADLMLLTIMKEFEKKFSLGDVKQKIITEKLDEKYFLSSYRIKFNPIRKVVNINLSCPQALAKVHIYKSNGEEHYSAILGENAKLYEPQYEILLKSEKILKNNLPLIALSTDQLETNAPTLLSDFIKLVPVNTRKSISEILLSKTGDLTVVFGLGNSKATSVFLGTDFWDVKVTKLEKLLSYVSKSKRFPTSINLVNAKKIVVKFSDTI